VPACVRLRLLAPVLALSTGAVLVDSHPALATTTRSTRAFVADTNHARSHHDRRELRSRHRLNQVAQRWAQWMATHRTLRHNPYMTSQCGNWQSLGENIGRGRNETMIQHAFMQSPDHRDNILSRAYTQIGIGTARGRDGRLYVDEVFRRPA
jgi:uncharacterized protein YkwD